MISTVEFRPFCTCRSMAGCHMVIATGDIVTNSECCSYATYIMYIDGYSEEIPVCDKCADCVLSRGIDSYMVVDISHFYGRPVFSLEFDTSLYPWWFSNEDFSQE